MRGLRGWSGSTNSGSFGLRERAFPRGSSGAWPSRPNGAWTCPAPTRGLSTEARPTPVGAAQIGCSPRRTASRAVPPSFAETNTTVLGRKTGPPSGRARRPTEAYRKLRRREAPGAQRRNAPISAALHSRKVSRNLALDACLNLSSAFSLICRTRSRVTPSSAPISSSVIGS